MQKMSLQSGVASGLTAPVEARRASARNVIMASARAGDWQGHTSRRSSIGLALVLPALLGTRSAFAEDAQAAKGASAERKEELREKAQQIKSTGEDLPVFPEGDFKEQEATTRGGKSEGTQKPRQEDSIQPSPFSSPK